ncbi:MAG TPA: ABC transporter substrate-binding protein [Candidatus Saccharimonadales bacterium]|nr:ABC transporter substrate-binding protein [Candidatus Saccharimonadales bacterium]
MTQRSASSHRGGPSRFAPMSFGLVACLLLAACGGGGATGGTTTSGGTTTYDVPVVAIGPPPIFISLYLNVAEKEGYFKKLGIVPTIRYFQNGTQVAANVINGTDWVAATSSQSVIESIAGGAPITALSGMNNQDFFVASSLPGVTTCASLKGKTIAQDSINNARYLYLKSLLATCGLNLSDVRLISSQNAALIQAAIAGQVTTGVFHINELASVEANTGKKWNKLPTPSNLEKSEHYGMLIVSKSALAQNKTAITHFLAAWILSMRFMQDPKNLNSFAKVASAATGDPLAADKLAIQGFQAIDYWGQSNDGLTQSQVMGTVQLLEQIGAVKPAQAPTYNQITDLSLYPAALKLANSVG